MDSGLSKRMARSLDEVRPKSAAFAPCKNYNPSTAIDLSTAQNEVLRPELQEFFTTTIENKLNSEVCVSIYICSVRVAEVGSISDRQAGKEEIAICGQPLPHSSTPTSSPYMR